MIKTWLYHTAFDACINIIYDGLKRNFPIAIDTSNLVVGEYLNVRILVGDVSYVLRGCRVEYQIDDLTYLNYDGFESPIVLVTKNGDLVDIKGSYDVITEHFI